MPRRYRIILWAVPLLWLQWIALALIEPDNGPGWMEYASIGFFFGTIFGQTTLAAAWMALGPGPLRWRVPLSLVWVVMLPVAIGINFALHDAPDEEAVLVAAVWGGCLFGQWLIVQLPLWGLAMGYSLRLWSIDDGEKARDRRELQFSIRHLLVVTAIVGVIFGVGRILVNWLDPSFRFDDDALVFVFLVVAAIALTLPLLLAGLLPRLALPTVLLVLTLMGFATAWELPLLRVIPAGRGGGPETAHFAWINAFTAATVLAGVAVARLNGYRATK